MQIGNLWEGHYHTTYNRTCCCWLSWVSCRERIICTIYLHCSLLLILDNQFEAVNSSYEYRARPDSKEWDHLFVSIGNYQSGYFNGRGCLPGRSLWYSFLRGPFLYRVFAGIFRHELFEVLKSFRIFCIICFGYSTKIFAPGNDVFVIAMQFVWCD